MAIISNPDEYCPGFDLWEVTMSDGATLTVAADNQSGAGWAAQVAVWGGNGWFRDVSDYVKVEYRGPNPHAVAWHAAQGRAS